MARRPTHRMRLPDRPDEPAAGPEDAPSPGDAAIQGSGDEPQTASAGRKTRRTSGQAGVIQSDSVASRRVAAAAAAAGAAAAGAAIAGLPSGEAAAAPTEPRMGAEPVPDIAAEASTGPKPDFEVAPVSAAGVAAASAVNAAIAATFAARASHAGPSAGPESEAAVSATTPMPAASNPALPAARPPVTVEGYRRSPAKDSPSIIRAHHDAPEGADAAVAAADPNRRFMRRSEPDRTDLPDVPGIIRAAHDPETEEAVVPPPLFSNEGIVRRAEAERRNRFLGPLGGLAAAFLGAGKAFGHTGGSSGPGTEALAATVEDDVLIEGSPDFLPNGNPRRSRKRKPTAILAAATLIAALFVVAAGAAFLPTENGPVATHTPGSSPTLPGIAALDKSLVPNDGPAGTADDPTALPSGLAIGDDPLPPGATRKPSAKPTTTAPAATPPSTLCPGQSASPSPVSTPTATATASPTACAASTPTSPPTPRPTPRPTRTPVPTPTPTPVMFALLYSVTPPAVSPGNGVFYVGSLPGASCRLWRLPVAGDNATRRSSPFTTDASGWYYAAWGSSWPISNVTVTVYATCTAASPDGRTAQSANMTALWPGHASPSPSAT